jgi:NADH-quinone oxidoreductase subunit E
VKKELKKLFIEILTPDKKDPRHLISLLQETQHKLGYISIDAMQGIADYLGIPGSRVYGVATFYNEFRFTPPGKYPVKVCMGTACHMAGGDLVMDAMSRELGIEAGGLTDDHLFSLDRVACVGCCALAPVVQVNSTAYPRMSPPKVEELLVSINPVQRDKPSNK